MFESLRGVKIKLFFIGILLMKSNYCDHREYFIQGNTSIDLAHFQRFQPFSQKIQQTHRWTNDLVNATSVSGQSQRQSRGFYFTTDDGDSIINLEFIIPIIHIPVARSMDLANSALRSLLNLHSRSLLWSGIIVVVGLVVKTIVSLLKQYFVSRHFVHYKTQRSQTFDEDFLSRIESILYKNNIDLQTSAEKFICKRMSSAKANLRMGKASNLEKIAFEVMRMPLVKDKLLEGTAIWAAVEKAKKNKSCD